MLATERDVARWLNPVGGVASKQMFDSRQQPFCNFVSKDSQDRCRVAAAPKDQID
jgi:hypothetical protein